MVHIDSFGGNYDGTTGKFFYLCGEVAFNYVEFVTLISELFGPECTCFWHWKNDC